MIGNVVNEEQELESIIMKSVDESVDRAFKKYGKISRFLRVLISLLVVLTLVVAGVFWLSRKNVNDPVAPVEGHDLTLENKGIFGFTVVDFQKPILGEATRQRLLIVEEQAVYVNTDITDTGFLNWGVLNKQQTLTINGTGQYTIDLTQVAADDISLNEDTYELTIRIPHAVLHKTIFDPSKTQVGDAQRGWLAFGEIKLTAEQQKEFEVSATEKLEGKLKEEACLKEADRFAKLSAYETYQPIVKTISPAYKVVIEFH